jgi:hypothetical protein
MTNMFCVFFNSDLQLPAKYLNATLNGSTNGVLLAPAAGSGQFSITYRATSLGQQHLGLSLCGVPVIHSPWTIGVGRARVCYNSLLRIHQRMLDKVIF